MAFTQTSLPLISILGAIFLDKLHWCIENPSTTLLATHGGVSNKEGMVTWLPSTGQGVRVACVVGEGT